MFACDCRKAVTGLLIIAGCLHGIAASAQGRLRPSQPGHILVVPQGETGSRIERLVTVAGEPASEQTVATGSWDDDAIAIVIDCEDDKVVATHTERDAADMWRDDCVEIFLDPGHSHSPMSSWFHVLVSAAGGIHDEQGPVTGWYSTGAVVSGNAKFDAPNLTAEVVRTPTGWRARVRIPWQDLGSKPAVGDVWGFNLNRTNHPDDEYLCFSPTHGAFYNIHQWGHLAFADAAGRMGDMTRRQLAEQLETMHQEIDRAARTIAGVEYDTLDPGEPFTPAPVPVQDWKAPEPTSAERAAGMLAYVTSDPGLYRPDGIPRPAEHASKLAAFLTPDEDEPVWFAVRGLADLQGLTVQVDLGDAPVSVDVRHMHFWPQRTGWQSRQWYITPELLLPFGDGRMQVPTTRGLLEERPFDLNADTTAAFWLTLTAEPDAKAGMYKATVRIKGNDRQALVLPLEIEVLPFRLQRPTDRHWTLYCDQHRWNHMSDQQIMAELRDFARHGITGLNSISLGSADLSEIQDGIVRFDPADYRRITTMAAEAGLPGPHVIRSWMAGAVRDVVAPGVDLEQGDWPQSVRDGVSAVARAAVEATRDLPAWYFYGVDEPRGENTYAIQDYQAWHAGGARTYATVIDMPFMEKAAAALTAPCFGVDFILGEKGRQVRERFLGNGADVSPVPPEGTRDHNRYGSGLLFWKSGAKGQAIWTYLRAHGDVFNDFDGSPQNRVEPKEQCTVYPHLLEPDDWSTYQGAIPTIAWEALREGADDYAYLHTLSRVIAEARDHRDPAVRREALDAEGRLAALVDSVPWASSMDAPAFDTSVMQQVRRKVADEIIRLQALLAPRPADAPAPSR